MKVFIFLVCYNFILLLQCFCSLLFTFCFVVLTIMSGDSEKSPKRMGMVIYLREEKREEYEQLHSQVWPQVKDRLTKSNMRNFTIYHCKELGVLFAHLEYIGDDIEADTKAIGDDPTTKEWWKKCEPCQRPLAWEGPKPSEGGQGDWWTPLREVWHDGHAATSFKE